MHNNHHKIIIPLIILLMAAVLPAQLGFWGEEENKDAQPAFFYNINISPLPGRDSVRLQIVLKVPFQSVQFLKKGYNTFTAKYEASILLLNTAEEQVASKIWKQRLQTEDYRETISQEHFDINKIEYTVVPDKYTLTLGIRDMDTKKSSYKDEEIDLRDYYAKSITLSNLKITERIIKDSTGTVDNVPLVMNSITDVTPQFYVSFDVLSDGGKGTVTAHIYNLDDKRVDKYSFSHNFLEGLDHVNFSISKKNLGYNKYRLKVTVSIGEESNSRQRSFKLRWVGMSKLIDNLDAAIEQLRYIATGSEIKKMENAKKDEKKKMFQDFWQQKDPTPATPENELMNEYYRRVKYANQHFSGYRVGWKTDMGMVFILFGPPDDIERHPFEIDSKPYEVWYYNNINRTFVFVDESGFGEYRLISPLHDYMGRF